MSSKTLKKFEEWFEKVSSHLKNKDETSMNELPSDCRFLEKAEENLNQEENITALVLADQSLELLLRDLCTRFGCDENTHSRTGKPFGKWGFTEYVVFLAKIGEIDKVEKGNFARFHEWRNAAYHLGLEPSVRLVNNQCSWV